MKTAQKTAYKRLETDSSEEETDKSQVKLALDLQIANTLKLQEDLQKKEEEIENLKRILIETQEKLQAVQEPSKNIEVKIENFENQLTPIPQITKKRFVEKFEDLVFVSKKNNQLIDELDEICFSKRQDFQKTNENDFSRISKILSNESEIKIKDPSLQESSFRITSRSRGSESGQKDLDLPKESFSEFVNDCISMIPSPKVSDIFEKTVKPSENSEYPNKKLSRTENHNSGDSFAGGCSPKDLKSISSGSLRCTPTLKNAETSPKGKKLDLDFENEAKDLNPVFLFEDSQSKLKKLVEVRELNLSSLNKESRLSKKNNLKEIGTNTNLNDLHPETKQEIISENFTEKIDKEIGDSPGFNNERILKIKSRTSSFPWIDVNSEDLKENEEVTKIDFFSPKKNLKKNKTGKKGQQNKEDTLNKNKRHPKEIQKKLGVQKKPPVPLQRSARPSNLRNKSFKSSEKSSRKKNQDSTLDEIIFDEEQDIQSWNKLMKKFRNKPEIVEKLMKTTIRPISQPASQSYRPKSSIRSKHPRVAASINYSGNPSTNALSEFRPISASFSKKIIDPDWSSSILDNFVSQNKKKFNFFGDPLILSSQDIDKFLMILERKQMKNQDLKKAFVRTVKTLEVLKTELMLPEFWVSVPRFSEENLALTLCKCAKLIRARNLTVKIIDLIQKRENVLLQVMGKNEARVYLKDLEKINEELLQVLVFWRYMELPFTSFVYLGEDYYNKIQSDNMSVSAIFPEFNGESIYKPPQNSDSFNFDI